MNKKLLVLAIGAAVAMPVAALADGPTIYGKINLSLEKQTTNSGAVGGADNGNWVVADNASRIGLKGTAETGKEGLTGIYNAEFALAADGDGGPLASRNIYAGLKGKYGTVLIGNIDTPTKTVQGKVDQFNDTTVDMAAYVAGETRAPNVVAYSSPKLGDAFTFHVASWQGENLTQAPAGGPLAPPVPPIAAGSTNYDGILEAVSAAVTYENGGFYLALALDKDIPSSSGLGGAGSVNTLPSDIVRVVGTYSTDSMTLGVLYQTAEATKGVGEETATVVSGAFVSGDLTWKLQYGMSETTVREGTLIALGADYALGKSTKVGAFIAKADGIFGATGPGGNGLALATLDNAEAMVVSFGAEQKF